MKLFKKIVRKLARLGAVGRTVSGIWGLAMVLHQGWELVNRYV
jgi:hypothetical protein